MRRSLFLLTILIFLLFLFEGTVMNLIIPIAWQSQVLVSPHFTFIAILFVSVFVSRHWGLFFGFAFGMLHDIVYYGPMLGSYSFTMGLVGYFIGVVASRSKGSFMYSMLLIVGGNLLFEVVIYSIYRIFRITHADFRSILMHQALPSIMMNLLFALLIYVPIRKLLTEIGNVKHQVEEDHYV